MYICEEDRLIVFLLSSDQSPETQWHLPPQAQPSITLTFWRLEIHLEKIIFKCHPGVTFYDKYSPHRLEVSSATPSGLGFRSEHIIHFALTRIINIFNCKFWPNFWRGVVLSGDALRRTSTLSSFCKREIGQIGQEGEGIFHQRWSHSDKFWCLSAHT